MLQFLVIKMTVKVILENNNYGKHCVCETKAKQLLNSSYRFEYGLVLGFKRDI
jgi:hypothetical protein